MHLGGKAMDRAKSLVKYIIAIAVLGSLLKIFLVLTIAVFKIVFSLIRVVEYN